MADRREIARGYFKKPIQGSDIPTIGCLGDIVFTVSNRMIQTLDNAVWSGSVRIAEHQRHNYNALTEFTGIDPDKFSFDLTLATFLGSNPMNEMVKIWKYEREFRPLPLIIGEKIYGKYRWTIKSHKHKFDHFDKRGNVVGVTVSVALLEYFNK